MNTPHTYETTVGGKTISVEIGKLAFSTNGSVRIQCGETVVLATAVMSSRERGGVDYFPLSVDFEEKFYAAGRIKGSQWVKREGRPSDEGILTARLIDRTLRPLFNQRVRHEVQVIVSVLSFDEENDPDILSIIGGSLALAISDIPWNGPVAAVRVAQNESGEFVINPTYKERETERFEATVSGPDGFINMLEGSAEIVPEKDILEGIAVAEKEREKLLAFQRKIQEEIGKEKNTSVIPTPDETIQKEVLSLTENGKKIEEALYSKGGEKSAIYALKDDILDRIAENNPDDPKKARSEADFFFEEVLDGALHRNVLQLKKRPDGRALDEVRDLSAEVGVLPRTHGSGLFQRGTTQALSILTLGEPGLEQSLETMEFVGKKRYMHHYNFPPFSVGETGRLFTGRREIGHGALAEKALMPVVPGKESFPYAIRIVSEILSSNGSTSMAATCGSSLALMDAGVPISEPVAGIALGLIVEDANDPEKQFEILTDIQGPEDHHGDMDLKVAGTTAGVTVFQMDVKLVGVTPAILEKGFTEARKARETILAAMKKAIPEARKELSAHAPRVMSLSIDPEKIGTVIGPGGKMINKITEETGVSIDIEDSGTVFITSTDSDQAERAVQWVKDLVREVEPGEVFTGEVVRILEFGAFVEVLPGKQGLVHISELAPWHVDKVEDIVSVGDSVKVRVKEIDKEGRINLTMKEFNDSPPPKK